MYGYVYLTTNKINNKIYIGQHKKEKYDRTYYGSGKLLKQAINKYGIENFTNEIIDIAESKEELDKKEQYWIEWYKEKFPDKIYNIAPGGTGGDVINNLSKADRENFIKKMTKINRERCGSIEFKQKTSERMKKKYSDPEERRKQSEKNKKAWSNPVLREEQSKRLKEYYKTHKKEKSFSGIPCCFELNGEFKEFESVKSLKKFLKDTYNYTPRNHKLKEILTDGCQGKKFYSYFPRHKNLDGALMYYKKQKCRDYE